jgi:D-3-phosphoglycerate dehydrogenase
MLILIAESFDEGMPQRLARFGEVTTDAARLAEASVVLVRGKTQVNREYLDRATRTKLIIRGGVGVDNIDVEYANTKGIRVQNTADASTIAVAEMAFALMIGVTNRLALADASVREGKWLKKELERTELYGKNLGIVGLGRIGRALGERAKAFGMTVHACDLRDLRKGDAARQAVTAVLGRCEYVSLNCPLTAESRGMIDAKCLERFRDGAFLINTARGECVVEEAIVAALRSGKLGGYATDVWHKEPPERTALFDAPNCLFAPHLGASTRENMTRIGSIVEDLLEDFARTR